jgi:hypothetical protein
MKDNMVRISFDIPENEHTMLKIGCAQARIPIKDFMHEMVLKGIQELEEDKLKTRLKLSIQQSKKGKLKSRGSFAKHAEDDI